MGAWLTSQVAAGKTPNDAYDSAVEEARAEYGHQQGYSGAINSKARGFALVELPPRFTYAKLKRLLEEYDEARSDEGYAEHEVESYRPGGVYANLRGAKGKLRKAEVALRRARARKTRVEKKIPAALRRNFDGIVGTYNDKWGPPLAVEIKGAEARKYTRVARRRGEKIYVFFGYAPS